MDNETPEETAHALLPGLQYLTREARDAGLVAVAGIIGRATNDVIEWIHENEYELGDINHDRDLPARTGTGSTARQ